MTCLHWVNQTMTMLCDRRSEPSALPSSPDPFTIIHRSLESIYFWSRAAPARINPIRDSSNNVLGYRDTKCYMRRTLSITDPKPFLRTNPPKQLAWECESTGVMSWLLDWLGRTIEPEQTSSDTRSEHDHPYEIAVYWIRQRCGISVFRMGRSRAYRLSIQVSWSRSGWHCAVWRIGIDTKSSFDTENGALYMSPSGWSTYRGLERNGTEGFQGTLVNNYFSKKVAKGNQAQSREDVPQSW